MTIIQTPSQPFPPIICPTPPNNTTLSPLTGPPVLGVRPGWEPGWHHHARVSCCHVGFTGFGCQPRLHTTHAALGAVQHQDSQLQ